jgi:hypothetical protein
VLGFAEFDIAQRSLTHGWCRKTLPLHIEQRRIAVPER